VRTSTVDLTTVPIYTPLGKPITDVEIDADLIEHEKPWRRPGADQSDYFNYGFDEFTWSTYCLRQKTIAGEIEAQKAENAKFEMMFGAGGMGGMDPMAAMMGGGMPGMPGGADMQAAMMEAMRAQGVSDPSKVDFGAFMNQLQGGGAMMGGNVPSGPAAQQYGGGGGAGQWGGHGGGGGGYGRGKRGGRWG